MTRATAARQELEAVRHWARKAHRVTAGFKTATQTLDASRRLLRIYFISDSRYEGTLTKEVAWTGRAAWANKLTAQQRKRTLEMLKLPEKGLVEWFLTEFEDNWPYRVAPG